MRWLVVLLLMAVPAVSQQQVTSARGAVLRVLDKTSGETTDLDVLSGQSVSIGRLTINLGDCRYPSNNPNSDAFGWLEIGDNSMDSAAFRGWMVASSPALNAMDHPRYDVWLLRCSNS